MAVMDSTFALARPEAVAQWPQTPAQFEALVGAVQDELVHFAWCRLRSQADAEDAVQDVLVRAYLDRARHSAVTYVRPYLYRMVANRCTDLLRQRRRAGQAAAADAVRAAEPETNRLDEVEALLRHLPRRQAEAIRLRVFGGLPFQSIAEAVGVSLPTIKSRFRYGVEKLRGIVSQEAHR
jgi:RNA polymerase sigma-70 factor, ECF subfamily